MAYADGALDDGERRRVEAVLDADPAQRARLAPFALTRTVLPQVFAGAMTEPLPQRLIDTVLMAPIGSKKAQSEAQGFWPRLKTLLFPELPAFANGLALAASVLAIAGAGWMAGHATRQAGGAPELIALENGALYAAGPLQTALDTAASKAAVAEAGYTVKPVLTFRDNDGRFCRQYGVTPAQGAPLAGLACRTASGRWSVAVHAPAASETSSDGSGGYQPAGKASLPVLEAAIDKMISGDVFSTAEEDAVRARSWQGE